jgi:hypothetical protein
MSQKGAARMEGGGSFPPKLAAAVAAASRTTGEGGVEGEEARDDNAGGDGDRRTNPSAVAGSRARNRSGKMKRRIILRSGGWTDACGDNDDED